MTCVTSNRRQTCKDKNEIAERVAFDMGRQLTVTRCISYTREVMNRRCGGASGKKCTYKVLLGSFAHGDD